MKFCRITADLVVKIDEIMALEVMKTFLKGEKYIVKLHMIGSDSWDIGKFDDHKEAHEFLQQLKQRLEETI